MSLKKTKFLIILITIFFISKTSFANESLKSVGKFKDWETFTMIEEENKVCFTQSIPVLQAPKGNERASRLFVTFRPAEKIQDEISVTAGYTFNNKNRSVIIPFYFAPFLGIHWGCFDLEGDFQRAMTSYSPDNTRDLLPSFAVPVTRSVLNIDWERYNLKFS